MKQGKLGDLFDYLPKSKIKAGEGLENGEYPFYTSSENQSKFLNDFQHASGCLVFGTGGKASVHLTTSRFATSTDCITIKPKSIAEIDAGYVFQYFKGNMKVLENGFKGAGLKHISKAYLSNILIPFPVDINDQRLIAHLLGKVEGLIAQRKQHIKQLDDLLKSEFFEMFGDYLKREEAYQPITKACDFIDYRGRTPLRSETGVPYISAKCVRRGYFDSSRLDFIPEDTFNTLMTRGYPKANDVLFTTEGHTFGYTCRIPKSFDRFSVGQRLITMACKNGFQPEVLEFILNDGHIQKKLASRLSGSAATGIRSSELAKVEIPYPPLAIQNQFSLIIEKVESIKSRYQKSLTDLETLYGALSQKAFKGELDLSRITLPEDTNNHTPTEEDNPLDMPAFLRKSNEPATPKQIVSFLAQNKLPDDRSALITQWFEHYLDETAPDSRLGSAQFLASTWQVLQSERFEVDGETPAITMDDYDRLKVLVFKALEAQKLHQDFDEETNQVKLQKPSENLGSW